MLASSVVRLQPPVIIEFPEETKKMSGEEIIKFREKYYDYYKKNYGWYSKSIPEGSFMSQLSLISNIKENYNFGTKVRIVNYGFMEQKNDKKANF